MVSGDIGIVVCSFHGFFHPSMTLTFIFDPWPALMLSFVQFVACTNPMYCFQKYLAWTTEYFYVVAILSFVLTTQFVWYYGVFFMWQSQNSFCSCCIFMFCLHHCNAWSCNVIPFTLHWQLETLSRFVVQSQITGLSKQLLACTIVYQQLKELKYISSLNYYWTNRAGSNVVTSTEWPNSFSFLLAVILWHVPYFFLKFV